MALDQVYGISARLDEAKDVSAFPSDFENILQFTKPTNKDNASRKLAITFIPRYIKHFESQQNAAVDVLIDLCEDDAQDVRLVSIRSFASVCKDVPKSLLSVADVLAQLLATESSAELEQVTKTLEELVRLSAKDVVSVLVTQVLTRPEKQQKRALEFLNSKIFENKDISPSIRESGDEGQLAIAQSLVKLIDVAENGLIEFEKIKKWISSLGTLKKEKNASQFTNSLQQLVNFDETKIEAAQISKLFLVMSLISKYQKVRVDSKATTTSSTTTTTSTEGQAQQPQQQDNKLLNFIAFKLLPQFEKVDEKFRLMMLQTIADNISKFSSENLVSLLDSVFQIATKFYLPDESQSTKPKLNFSFVEAILVILYSIAKNNTMAFRQYFGYKRPFTGQPSDFQPLPADQQKKQASFQKSLTWLSEQSQTYLKDLKEALPNITESSAKTVALTAQRTTETIHSIASDLRKENPSFSATPQVSWKRSFDNSDKKRKQKEQQKTDQKSTTTSNTSNTQSHPSKKQKTNNNNNGNNGNNGNNQQKQQNQQQRPRQNNNNNNNNNSNQQNRKQGGGNRNNNNNGNGNNQQRRNNNNNNNNNTNNNNGGSGRIPSLYDNSSSGKRKFGQF